MYYLCIRLRIKHVCLLVGYNNKVCATQARIQGRWNGWIFTPLFLSPLLSFFSYPSNIEIIFDFSDIITKFTPHFKILDPPLPLWWAVVDPDLELRGCSASPASFPSFCIFISLFYPKLGAGPQAPSLNLPLKGMVFRQFSLTQGIEFVLCWSRN